MLSFLQEFYDYLKTRRKFWLLPIIIVLFILGGLLIFSKGSAIAPFLYTVF